jgi:hypothetical protein
MQTFPEPLHPTGVENLRRQIATTCATYLELVAGNYEPWWDTYTAVGDDATGEVIYELWETASHLGFFSRENYAPNADHQSHIEALHDGLREVLPSLRSLVKAIGARS